MKKEFTINEIEGLYYNIANDWDTNIKDIKLGMRSLYNLICLKKKIEEQHLKTQETVAALFKSHGATQNEDGGLKIPEEQSQEVNQQLNNLGNEKTELEFEKIVIKEEDSFPPKFFEVLFDFIEF